MKRIQWVPLLIMAGMLWQNHGNAQAFTQNHEVKGAADKGITSINLLNKAWYFEEYKGQEHNAIPGSQVKYLGRGKNFKVLFEPDKIILQLHSTHGTPDVSEATGLGKTGPVKPKVSVNMNETMTTQCIELSFDGSNTPSSGFLLQAQDKQIPVYNYYFDQSRPGITGVQTYKSIVYKEIYPHIDAVFYADEKGLKYEFQVKPGGDVSKIKLKWAGEGNFALAKEGNLVYMNQLGTLTDAKPIGNQGATAIETRYKKSGNIISFETGKYDHGQTMVIDPLISWSTYVGNSGDDQGSAVAVDKANNIYVSGQTASSSGFATSGTFQSAFGGGAYDAFLSKFSSVGKLLWTSYFGGNDQDLAYCDAVDTTGAIYIAGTTQSAGINTSGAYQTTNNGSADIFIAKFTTAGALTWSTYFGGTGQDYATSVATDSKLNVIITGGTYSQSPMATSGAYQTTNNGSQDAFLAKFNSAGSLQWSTLYGGGSSERSEGLGIDSVDNIFITGPTSSTTNIATSGSYQSTYMGGNCDSYIAKFDPKGAMQWATYIGGSGEDASFGLAMDKKGNPVITGYAWSTSKIATSGTSQTSIGGVADAFLQKFSSSGSLIWGTYEGGSGSEISFGVGIDQNDNIFLTGFTQSSSGIATSGAYQTSYGGGNLEAMISKFNKNGGRVWSTYFGGGGSEQGMAIVASKGFVYTTGYTNSTSAIATGGASKTSYGGGANDAFLVAFQDSCFHHKVSLLGDKSNCISSNLVYYTHSFSGSTYKWSISGGTIVSTITDTIVTVKWNKTTTGTLKIIHTNLLGCTDSAILTLKLDTLGAQFKFSGPCIGDSTQFSSTTKSVSRKWDFGDGTTSTVANPKHVFAKAGNYTVKFAETDSSGCKDSVTQAVPIVNYPTVNVGKGTSICQGNTANIGAPPVIGDTYAWISNPSGFSSTSNSPSVNPSVTTIYYLTEKNALGCGRTDSVTILVNPLPNANAGPSKGICIGDSLKLGDSAIAGHTYSWTSSPAGFTSSASQIAITPNATTTYALTELIIASGCTKTNQAKITVNALPSAKVGAPQTVCAGSSVTLGTFAVAGDSYSWTSSPSGFSSSISNPSDKPSTNTYYYLTETVNSTGCKKRDSVQAIVNPLPGAVTGATQNICFGDSTFIGFNPVTGSTYSWSSIPSGFGSTTSQPKVAPQVVTTYYLTETITATGCQKTNSVKIEVLPSPDAATGNPQSICNGDSASIGSTPITGNSYSWTSDPTGFTSTLSNLKIAPSVTTTYFLTETIDGAGCHKTNSVKITILPTPDAHFSLEKIPVRGLKLVAADTLEQSYKWNFGDGSTGSDFDEYHVYTNENTYNISLKVTGSNGCSSVHDTSVKITTAGINGAHSNSLDLNVYPNPFSGNATIGFVLPNACNVRMELLDAMGRKYMVHGPTRLPAGKHQTPLQTENSPLKPGIYLLKLYVDDVAYTMTVIKM